MIPLSFKNRSRLMRRWMIVVCTFAMTAFAPAQERRLTLTEAIDLAQHQNHGLKAAAFEVAAEQQKQRIAKANYFPVVSNETTFMHTTNLQRLEIPAGAFGAGIPASSILLSQGTQTFEYSGTTIAQPITQLIKIHEGNKIAAADVGISEA